MIKVLFVIGKNYKDFDREYVENEASYKSIVDSFGNIYKEVYKNKNA